MLQIFTKSPTDKEHGSTKTFEWYCTGDLYIPDPFDQILVRLHTTHVEAEGNELIWVREHFANIPMFNVSVEHLRVRRMRWSGPDAQFIAFNITEFTAIREKSRKTSENLRNQRSKE